MGRGRGKATADDVFTYPKIAVVNGGRAKVFFSMVLTNPARVRMPVLGTLTKPGGKWSYRLHVRIPRALQVVVGVPIVLRELHIKAGDPRKDWIAITSCPRDRRWRYHVLITFTTGPDEDLRRLGALPLGAACFSGSARGTVLFD